MSELVQSGHEFESSLRESLLPRANLLLNPHFERVHSCKSNYYFCRAKNPGVVWPSKTQNLSTLSWKSSFTKGWWHVYPGSYTFFFSLWHHGGCQRPFPFLWYEAVDFIMKIFFYIRLTTCIPRFLHNFFQPLTSWRLSEAISISMVWICWLYYENLLL